MHVLCTGLTFAEYRLRIFEAAVSAVSEMTCREGARELLECCYARGLPMAIASGSPLCVIDV